MKIDPYNTNGENLSPDKYFYFGYFKYNWPIMQFYVY